MPRCRIRAASFQPRQQGAATQEIACDVQQAAQAATQVTESVADVNRGAADTASQLGKLKAVSLSAESNHLSTEVQNFLHKIRAI